MMDSVASNHAAIVLVNETWYKTLNELYCHLHPLDTLASSSRSAFRNLESEKGKLFGNDCFAANIVLQMNKIRYKDGKEIHMASSRFSIPRSCLMGSYSGIAETGYTCCFTYAANITRSTTPCCDICAAGLPHMQRKALLQDFPTEAARLELQVLGLFGKLLSGPWMRKFHTSGESDISHIQGIGIIKVVIMVMREEMADHARLPASTSDFFRDALDRDTDTTLNALLKSPVDDERLSRMMQTVISATITVLERQYKVRHDDNGVGAAIQIYFDLDVTEKLTRETR